jgi:hypothetical protein
MTGARLPDFYIIGAMKCATSTLHEQLARRSTLYMSEPKEPNFFSDDAAYARGMTEYEALFSAARADQIVGESSTHYTKLPTHRHVVERIFLHTPQARFVYVMREPIARLLSQYTHEWLRDEVDRPVDRAVVELPRFVAYSSYATQLAPYVEKFGKERILPVFFECLVAHPEEELERVARFVGDTSEQPFIWHEEIAKQNDSGQRLKNSRLRDALVGNALGAAIKSRLPASLREGLKDFWKMKRKPQLSPEVERQVTQLVDRDLRQLSQWLGLELSCASFARLARDSQPSLSSPPVRLAPHSARPASVRPFE